jgi:uncharacterized repeat protein (TIGR01451 family)
LTALLAVSAFATAAGADNSVTYTAIQTIPVPPASNYAGSGGGDGWAVALTPTAVYNVFHHSSALRVACHLQADASSCWDPKTITDASGSNFATSGQPGLWLDQATGRLYVFATRGSDTTGGVVCIDTTIASTTANPFCGFTALTGVREAVGGTSGISDPVVVGSRWFAFNYVGGAAATGAQNKLLCFDLSTLSACAGQPFAVNVGTGTVSAGNFPAPSIAAIGDDVIVPITVDNTTELACIDGATLGDCGRAWPVTLGFAYPSSYGAPFPLMTASGDVTGLCLPAPGIPCYSLAGASVATPPGMTAAITPTSGWNGPAFVLGPRVYVPNGNSSQVQCYDYNLSAGCANFPRSFTNPSLYLLYTVNADPQRPACIWVNSDSGTQIQNFDAYTGGACGEGAIRVLASSSVVDTTLCTPGSWTSLQVTSPPPGAYESGSVAFEDASGRAIPGAEDVQLDDTGTASLSGLDLAAGTGLPQFLITLAGTQGKPGSVVVQLTWTGAFDPSCLTKPGTTVGNPPPSGPSGPPAKSDVSVSLTPPAYGRTGRPLTFTVNVSNGGPNTATGVVLRTPVPANATLVSAKTTLGNGCTLGATARCFIGTLTPGASATVTMVFTTSQAGPLTITPFVEADYDTNAVNNSTFASAPVLSPDAPPPPPSAPTQPGTYNAVGSGTIRVNGVDHPADQLFVLNSGDIVDVTDGVITFTAADGSYGTFSSSRIVAARRTSSRTASDNVLARFRVDQPAAAGDPTTLTLVDGDFTTCTAPRSVSAAGQKPVRQLWGSAKGKFRTVGRYSAATIRGTVWLTQDRCDGTLTQVVESVVDVLDLSLQKTVAVNPGQTYLALPKRASFKPPANQGSSARTQSAARIKLNGLTWAGRRFATRKAFEAWLTSKGSSWARFRTAYPVQAAALASRK